jgi:aspartyl-tRNA(Asn)/glutamyl-tRNA(Gln) amidotransferase subunit A
MSTRALSAADLRAAIAGGDATAIDACRRTLDDINRLNPRLNAFRHPTPDRALARAKAADDRRSKSDAPLLGVPIAVKDNICTAGVTTTAGSKLLGDYVPPYDATVVARLERAGAVVVGKTNCDEFAMGSSTEYSAFGPTRNPWAEDRTPGGSSGGSASAVAAGLVPLALGSDTGGSIRQPAALCGVVGLKPTYGRVSRYGLIAFASSLDQIGPFARSTRDAAALLNVIAGHDPRDATTATLPVPDYTAALTGEVSGIRVGVPRDLLGEGVDEDVAAAFEQGLACLADAGAVVSDVRLPHAGMGIPVYYLVAPAEASSNLARFDGVRYGARAAASTLREMYDLTREQGFGPEVKRRIMIGTYVLSAGYYDAYYLKAQQVRTLIRRDYDEAFRRVDLVAFPTSPTAAFRLGERSSDPMRMYLSDVFTVSANLAGLPAISVPAGFTRHGRLPVGLQLTARPFDEAALLRAAEAIERRASWWRERPPIFVD